MAVQEAHTLGHFTSQEVLFDHSDGKYQGISHTKDLTAPIEWGGFFSTVISAYVGQMQIIFPDKNPLYRF